MNSALILSGGNGTRFHSSLPKQYHKIGGKMVIEYALCAAQEAGSIDEIIVVGAPCRELCQLQQRYRFSCAPGGETRNESLLHGLSAAQAIHTDCVIILDAVRPLVTAALVDEYVRLIGEGWDAVSTVQPITDSLGCLDAHTCDRSRYYLMQSPEAYNLPLLMEHFCADSPLTEVAQQLPESSRLYLYRDFPLNPKLTYPWDKAFISHILKEQNQL